MKPRIRDLIALSLIYAMSCSWLAKPNSEEKCQFRTGDSGLVDPCPTGSRCVNGICQSLKDGSCKATAETCNQKDDDCDGRTDEGFDLDADGVSVCVAQGAQVDCDDNDSTVFPITASRAAGIDVCDGKDNDCDGVADNGSAILCPGGTECVDRSCVVPNCTMPGRGCLSTQHCDVSGTSPVCASGTCSSTCPQSSHCENGVCIADPLGVGSPCVVDAQCASEVCSLVAALGVSTGAKVCTKACCDDTQCEAGEICWASGTGAKVCLPSGSQLLGGLIRGTGGPEVSCAAAPATSCRSGICLESSNRCLGNCSVDGEQCPGAICGIVTYSNASRSDFAQLACRPRVGSTPMGMPCTADAQCISGMCVHASGGKCSRACDSTCPGDFYCGYILANSIGNPDWVQACIPRFPGDGSGATCSRDSECRSRLCVNGVCAETCCNDTHCPQPKHCRPVHAGIRWEMHCI